MTRKEEIQMQAEKKALEPSRLMHPYAKQHKVMSAYEIGFIEGAVWADAHPDITMAAWQSGYKEAIEKACEWLSAELDKEEERHYIHVHGFDKVEDFRKAMKGGEKLDADKVIEWLKPYSVIEDNIINEFKKDFGL